MPVSPCHTLFGGEKVQDYLGVAHDDLPALVIVGLDAHLGHVVGTLDAQGLVDLVLDGEAVRVPPEASLHVVAMLVHPPVTRQTKKEKCRGVYESFPVRLSSAWQCSLYHLLLALLFVPRWNDDCCLAVTTPQTNLRKARIY